MKVLYRLPRKKIFIKDAVVTIGVFDGMHRGHVRLIRETVLRARRQGRKSVVITFAPHPVHVLRPQIYCPLIISLEHRLEILSQLGVDFCWVIAFKKSFAKIPPDRFIQKYLLKPFSPAEVVVGDDFRFGQNRRGTLKTFRSAAEQLGFSFVTIATRSRGKKNFSSTRIREYIIAGRLDKAAQILGRPVSVLGYVVHGDAIGRDLGYPTANIHPGQQLLPPSGIYVITVRWRKKVFAGVAYLGRRPSLKRMSPIKVEAHIFDFHRNLYGQEILVEFHKKIREEKIFRSQDELVKQIHQDELVARQWFSKNNKSPRQAF